MTDGYPASVLDTVHLAIFLRDKLRPHIELVQEVRKWAQSRHIYGTSYGYPGGAAWAVICYVYIESHPEPHNIHSFFGFLAEWPWPLPMTTNNAHLCQKLWTEDTIPNGREALLQSISRFSATSCIIPLPCGTTHRNMTQSVGSAQLMTLQNETSMPQHQLPLLTELLQVDQQHQWPLYLSMVHPAKAISFSGWLDLITHRLVRAVVPQLQVSGMLSRVLCTQQPIVIALWINTAEICDEGDNETIRFPMAERCLPTIFEVVRNALLESGLVETLPSVLPRVRLCRQLPPTLSSNIDVSVDC